MQKSMNFPDIYNELVSVHELIAQRPNFSSMMIANMAMVEKDFLSSVASSILTLGGVHAPIIQTMDLYDDPNPVFRAETLLLNNRRIPGSGSSFVQGEPDPVFHKLDEMISDSELPRWSIVIKDITSLLEPKALYPNAATYTAVVCLMNNIPKDIAIGTVLSSRLGQWEQIYLENYNPMLP